MAKCVICDKSVNWGNKLSITRSHISKRTSRTFKPNLRTVKTLVNGQPKRVTICAKCLKAGRLARV
jgi:large subunit ribosomal protein L28